MEPGERRRAEATSELCVALEDFPQRTRRDVPAFFDDVDRLHQIL